MIREGEGYISRKKLGNWFDKLKEETSSSRVSTFAIERGWPSRRKGNLTTGDLVAELESHETTHEV